jgi:uncharacterized metal-binding protein YceD (DUF177 family)
MTSPENSLPEFSRMVELRQCDGRDVDLVATAEERSALAGRFGLVRIDRLEAKLSLSRLDDGLKAEGTLDAKWVQSCAVSDEDLAVSVLEPLTLRFVPAAKADRPDEDMEIDSSDPDEIEFSGTAIDLGEAVAQSLALAIDPFAVGPDAEEARESMRDESDSPFAALAALKLGQDKDAG